MKESLKLNNKIVLVTGSASGIGKQIATKFCSEGAVAIIADINYESARKTADELSSFGGKTYAIEMDVTKEAQVASGIKEIEEKFQAIDILVSNAGIQIIHPIEKLSFDDWKKMIAIHLDGAFLTTKYCYQSMISSGKGGSILYIGSVHSKEASVLKSPYVTAKHGLNGLCKTVAKEGAKFNIRSNLICPGFVKTPLVEKQIPEQANSLGVSEETVIKQIMLKDTIDGEFTSLEDVAEVALFFSSFPSKALSGQSLIVSHGWCMQ
jgi:3-hydroxybutyrate dehydrogenase